MSRRSDALTGDMFANISAPAPLTPGSMDFRSRISSLTAEVLKAYPGSRYEIAAKASELADVETSKAVLDAYASESRPEFNLPLWKAPVIEIVTGTRIYAEWHAGILGGRILWGAEVLDADVGRTGREITELEEQLKKLKQYQKRGGR